MGKRAVIYIRTSSEQQGAKDSPIEQEADCRVLAEQEGMIVLNVYKDIKRYRKGSKWFQPSGTRYDRPGLLAMLRDAADDQFDVILAWREDRLYRGMRAMLLVLETMEKYRLEIMLAKETFDPMTAPIKAWLAQMEIENIKERMTMGVKARLRAGKANSGQDRYGYVRNEDAIEVVEAESFWVKQIFAWAIEKVPLQEMRQRLIAGEAPQQPNSRRKIPWAYHSIKGILYAAEEYAFGRKIQSRSGEAFEIPVKPIIDMETYQAYLKTKRKHKPAPYDSRQHGLLRGMLFCPCGNKWGLRGTSLQYQTERGEIKDKDRILGTYFCRQRHEEMISDDCPRSVKRLEADRFVWAEVSGVINQPDILMHSARLMAERASAETVASDADIGPIEKELENITYQRQWIITQARKGGMPAEEMDKQLITLSRRETELKRLLRDIQEEAQNQISPNWEYEFHEYLTDIQAGIEGLETEPQNIEAWREAYQIKEQVVQIFVKKVTISKSSRIAVELDPNFLQKLAQLKEEENE